MNTINNKKFNHTYSKLEINGVNGLKVFITLTVNQTPMVHKSSMNGVSLQLLCSKI